MLDKLFIIIFLLLGSGLLQAEDIQKKDLEICPLLKGQFIVNSKYFLKIEQEKSSCSELVVKKRLVSSIKTNTEMKIILDNKTCGTEFFSYEKNEKLKKMANGQRICVLWSMMSDKLRGLAYGFKDEKKTGTLLSFAEYKWTTVYEEIVLKETFYDYSQDQYFLQYFYVIPTSNP